MSEKFIEHPFEELFDIEPGTTLAPDNPLNVVEINNIRYEGYDDKDVEIETQFQTVYEAAFNAFAAQMTSVDRGGNPNLVSKNLESANEFLNTALNAAKEKAELKFRKDKNRVSSLSSTNITNNNLIMDRNELLNLILKGSGKNGEE